MFENKVESTAWNRSRLSRICYFRSFYPNTYTPEARILKNWHLKCQKDYTRDSILQFHICMQKLKTRKIKAARPEACKTRPSF